MSPSTAPIRSGPAPSTDAGGVTGPTRASRPAGADVLVREHETAPRWMRAVGCVLLVAGLALGAAVLGWPGNAPETALIVPALVAVVVGALLVTARTGLTVTSDAVVLHFRPLPRRRVDRARIADVRVGRADADTYGGIGLRIGRHRRALLMTPGRGVVFTDDRGRATFVRSDAPTEAVRAILRH